MLRAAGASDTGRVRPNNEDRFHCDAAAGIFIVVDGVGGHAAGERAAELALLAVRARLERGTGSVAQRLREGISSANEIIREESRAGSRSAGMSCVLTAAVVRDGRVCAGHVGDTRLYKLRGGGIVKLTRDHSPVGALEDEGHLDERSAMRHPRRNEIWRDVGSAGHRPDDPDFVDIVEDQLEPDAALLLCSDGLSDLLSSREIASTVYRRAGSPGFAALDLIHAANRAGGSDNVTAIVVEGPQFASAARAGADEPGAAAGIAPGAPDPHRAATIATQLLLSLAIGAGVAGVAQLALLETDTGAEFLQVAGPRGAAPGDAALSAEGRTLRVEADGGPEASTIAAAIALAHPGDTIVLGDGTYRESIALPEGVTLVSARRHGAELRRPPGHTGPWTAITIRGIDSGAVRGLRIVGSEAEPLETGIDIRDAIAAIEDVEVTGARDSAIRIDGAAAPTIRGCALHENAGVGIRVAGSAVPHIAHTAIVGNGLAPPHLHGIEVREEAGPVLLWNVIAGNGRPGIGGLPAAALAAVTHDNTFELPADGQRSSP